MGQYGTIQLRDDNGPNEPLEGLNMQFHIIDLVLKLGLILWYVLGFFCDGTNI